MRPVRRTVELVAATLATLIAYPVGTASAEPVEPGPPSGSCDFTLSAPVAAETSGGTRTASASIQAGACATGNPTSVTVCIALENGRSEFADAVGYTAATVNVTGSALGRTTATGTGCWRPALAQPFQCSSLGPLSSNL